jgi:hypothetical protein
MSVLTLRSLLRVNLARKRIHIHSALSQYFNAMMTVENHTVRSRLETFQTSWQERLQKRFAGAHTHLLKFRFAQDRVGME